MPFLKAGSAHEAVEFLTDVKDYDRKRDFCGVTAIAAITGLSSWRVTKRVWQARGNQKPVSGMNVCELINVLGLLGYRVDMFDYLPKRRIMTVNRFWHERGDEWPACILHTAKHYIAMDCFGVIDTHSHGRITPANTHPCARFHVKGYFEVRKLP